MRCEMAKCERCPTMYLSGGGYDLGLCAVCLEQQRMEEFDNLTTETARDIARGPVESLCRVCGTEPAFSDTGVCRWEGCEQEARGQAIEAEPTGIDEDAFGPQGRGPDAEDYR